MIAKLLLACSVLSGPAGESEGTLLGTVVNASRGNAPASHAEVVLRLRYNGQLVLWRETTADAQGRFVFEHLPLSGGPEFVPGANCGGVHYPGQPVQLGPDRPCAVADLVVCEAVTQPSPLVIRRQEIVLRPTAGALTVTESIVVDNPSSACYVGLCLKEGDEPVTFRLGIPADFERVTFQEEFLGRRFSVRDGKLVTGIPWPPGKREVKFTYVLRTRDNHGCWQRPLDLPCDQVLLRVEGVSPAGVSCNLPAAPGEGSGQATFQAAGRTMPAGHVVRVELGSLPMAPMAYARWVTVALLAGLVLAAVLVMMRRGGVEADPLKATGGPA